jgi:hypothetical protein
MVQAMPELVRYEVGDGVAAITLASGSTGR